MCACANGIGTLSILPLRNSRFSSYFPIFDLARFLLTQYGGKRKLIAGSMVIEEVTVINNRIAGYLESPPRGEVDILFWSDFAGVIKNGGISVRGSVRLEISEEGGYRLKIFLSPERE